MNSQPELTGILSDVEIIEVNGGELLVLLERCELEHKVVAILQCVGTARWRATVYPRRERKEQMP